MERSKQTLEHVGLLVEQAYYTESHVPFLSSRERALLGRVPFLRRRIAVLARKP